jgi:hypothetical protein
MVQEETPTLAFVGDDVILLARAAVVDVVGVRFATLGAGVAEEEVGGFHD